MIRCPKCSSKMVLRTVTKGKNNGGKFYGCINFPRCWGVRNFEGDGNPEIRIGTAFGETQLKRHKLWIDLTSKFWLLEEEKLPLREKLALISEQISRAHKANTVTNDVAAKAMAAQLNVLEKIKKQLANGIGIIKEKQISVLREIEKFLVI